MMKSLTEKQRKILKLLSNSGLIDNFYLAGGTALSIRYKHRISIDFDFFTQRLKTPMERLKDRIFRNLKEKAILSLELIEEDTMVLSIDDIFCSFFLYDYPLLKDLEKLEEIFIASDEDIACMKAVSIAQRGAKKDFFDLYFLMKMHNWKLKDIILLCEKKYGLIFPTGHFLKSISYFEDAERQVFPEIDKIWGNIKEFFLKEAKLYTLRG